MKIVKAVISILFTLLLIYTLNNKFGDIPPLAKFLDPFNGFWANAENKVQAFENNLIIKGLKEQVEIHFDDQMIPHIFAKNDHDLYFAQGYLTAKDRLWQMDFQTRFASGRLSEVVGPKSSIRLVPLGPVGPCAPPPPPPPPEVNKSYKVPSDWKLSAVPVYHISPLIGADGPYEAVKNLICDLSVVASWIVNQAGRPVG